jgi:hypothetical protein
VWLLHAGNQYVLTARRDNTRLSSTSCPSPDLSATTLPASAPSVHRTNVPLHHLWTRLETRPRAPFVPLLDAGEAALSLPVAVKYPVRHLSPEFAGRCPECKKVDLALISSSAWFWLRILSN